MSKSIDEIIRQAMQRGEFDNLKNSGKKLNLDDYFQMPEEVRVGYTMLKNADFVPPEVELLKEIAALEESLSATPPKLAGEIRRQIRDKRLQYNLLMEKFRKR